MANFMDKMQVNTAITDNTKLDLGHQMITTADFMQLQPIFTKEMVAGEKLDVNVESFARLNPLPVPTFGRSSLRLRSFFVPYRTVFRGWNDFITDSVHVPSTVSSVSAIISQVPQFTNKDLVDAFVNYSAGTADGSNQDLIDQYMTSNSMVWELTSAGLNTVAWDIKLVDDADTVQAYYVLTQRGRQALKILESLGYKIAWIRVKAGVTGYYNPSYSALSLLCLARVYADYYWPNQYTNMASYDDLMSYVNRDNDNNTYYMTYQQINTILNLVSYVQYDTDYFTVQWDQPNQPVAGTYSTDFKLVNIDSAKQLLYTSTLSNVRPGYVTNNGGIASIDNRLGVADAPFITPYTNAGSSGTTSAVTPISEYLLTALKSLTDWMKRNQLSGSKAAERYISRYGKALTSEQLGKSVYLGASMQDVQIGDIMSTSDTVNGNAGEQLGAYAGRGYSAGQSHFDYQTNEFGMFITLCSIVPKVGYFQGVDRTVKHLSKWDFYQPEADALGVQPTASDELYVPQDWSSDYTGIDQQIFGYMPRYAEYKIKLDKVVGNFRLPSVNGSNPNTPAEFNGANSWYLMRVFDNDDFAQGATDIVHSPNFISGRGDFSQFKRIFYDVSPSAPDNFTVIHNFEIASYSPMKSLFDTYEFSDKGKKVTVDVNGVKMN